MLNSARVTWRDLREAYLLLGECCQVGASPEAWSRQLHEGFRDLLRVQISLLLVGTESLVRGRAAPDRDDRVVTFGWPSARAARLAREYFRSGAMCRGPVVQAWGSIPGSLITRSRQQLVDDEAWYRSSNYHDYYRQSDSDQMVLSRCRLPTGHHMLLNLWRATGDPPFSARDTRLLALIHREIRRLYGARLTPLHEPPSVALSPRLRQVLALLMNGRSEKEIGSVLHVSPHTVHGYVKALHAQFKVHSRAELLAAYARYYASPPGGSRAGIMMPLETDSRMLNDRRPGH